MWRHISTHSHHQANYWTMFKAHQVTVHIFGIPKCLQSKRMWIQMRLVLLYYYYYYYYYYTNSVTITIIILLLILLIIILLLLLLLYQ